MSEDRFSHILAHLSSACNRLLGILHRKHYMMIGCITLIFGHAYRIDPHCLSGERMCTNAG